MADVDVSSYKQPAPINPLDTFAKIGAITSTMNQNKLFGQRFDANKAISQAVKAATGPDGRVDQNKLGVALANDPRAAWDMLPTMKNAADLQTAQTGAASADFDLHAKNLNMMRSALSSLVTDPTVTPQKVVSMVGTMIRQGVMTPQIATAELAQMPQDPAGLRNWLTNHLMNVAGAQAQLAAQNTGVTSSGIPVVGTQAQFARQAINSQPLPGQQPQRQQAPMAPQPSQQPSIAMKQRAPVVSVPGGQGQDAPAPRASGPAPVQSPPATQNTEGIPGIAMGLPPGQKEAAEVLGQQSGTALASDTEHAAKITERTFPLVKAIGSLEALGKTGTGPGTEQVNAIKSFLQSAGVPGVDTDKIKNFDEAKKYLTDYVNRTGNTGTNDKLAAAMAGNPSVNISNAAAVDVAKSAVALERMRAAQAREFAASGKPASEYTKWAADWNAKQDPRAYGFDLMSPEAKLKFVGSLGKGPERDKFLASLKAAHNNNLIQKPGT